MFYWLYHSYHHDGYLKRPLIIWLQVKHDADDESDNVMMTMTFLLLLLMGVFQNLSLIHI